MPDQDHRSPEVMQDLFFDTYMSWCDATGDLHRAYRHWCTADRPDRRGAHLVYVAALDRESAAARAYERIAATVAESLTLRIELPRRSPVAP
jgi:hypothetical protein